MPSGWVAFLVLGCLASVSTTSVDSKLDTAGPYHMDILMKGAKPMSPDAYLCTSYEVTEEEVSIVKFEALADADTAHHILMYGCSDGGYSTEDIWECPPICRRGAQQIMFAWAKNAPPTQLPDGVGFRIGRQTSIKTIVMQIHYAKSFRADETPDRSGIRLHLSPERQPYVAGIFLMLSYSFSVPPNNPKYHVDMSCSYTEDNNIFPFAYRTHAHGLGSVITGYQYNDTGYHMIGKGNPQWPQAFYPANPGIEIKPGDKLVCRTFATGSDEMCNFYIMFYTDSSVEEPAGQCGGSRYPSLVKNMPADSDVPLPPNPLLDDVAHGHHHPHHHSAMGQSSPSLDETRVEPPADTEAVSGTLQYEKDWPREDTLEGEVGQVGGVATDHQGNVYVFHRGSRVWDEMSFDLSDNFQFKDQPIMEDTVIIFTPEGHLIRKFGSGKFFMPHGLSVDSDGSMWLTDVALHQVFRIPSNSTEPDLTLGERFINGEDDYHFCKPTDVAVLSTGEFFVSDGYCNARVLKFSKDGKLLKQWGRANSFSEEPGPGEFFIPHSLAVMEDQNLLCVADRENGRVQCFDLEGNFKFFIKHSQFGSRLFAVEYCPKHGGLLYAVNGPSFGDRDVTVQGFTLSLRDHSLLETWNLPSAQGLQNPHDVAVDVMGHAVYVGEVTPTAVWKFQRQTHSTTTASVTTTSTASTTRLAGEDPVPQHEDKKDNIEPSNGESMEAEAEAEDNRPSGAESLITDVKEEGKAEKKVDFSMPAVVVGLALVVPVILVLVIALVRHNRANGGCGGKKTAIGFSVPAFLGSPSHKGFDKLLSQEDSDVDLTDSDVEEFRRPLKTKP